MGALFSRRRGGLRGCRREGWALEPAFLGMHAAAEREEGGGVRGSSSASGRQCLGDADVSGGWVTATRGHRHRGTGRGERRRVSERYV